MTEHDAKFTDWDAPVELDYRPMSRAAWVSVPITLLAFLALLTPVFWIMPVLSCCAAFFALRGIARSEIKLAGRGLAFTTLTISVVLLGFAPTNYLTSRSIACHQARHYADAWLELLKQGKFLEAHQLTQLLSDRQPPGADLAEFYRERFGEESSRERMMMMEIRDPARDLQAFLKAEPVDQLTVVGKDLEVVYRSGTVTKQNETKPVTIVELRYDALLPVAEGTRTMPFVLVMERSIEHATRQAHWRVKDVSLPK